jgi:hypothetical protein
MEAEELAEMSANQKIVFSGVMHELSRMSGPGGELEGRLDFLPTIDGLIQAIATMAVQTGYLERESPEQLADRIRAGVVAHIADAQDPERNEGWVVPKD